MIRTLACALLVCLCPRPSAAQMWAPLEISGGYSAVNDPKNLVSLPVGWMAGGALRVTDSLAAVADVSGHHTTVAGTGSDLRLSVLAVMGGLRASGRIGRATEFGQLLAGVARGSGSAFGVTTTTSAFALQPGAGLDYPLSAAFSARGEVDLRFIKDQGEGDSAGHEYRFVVGLVYRLR
jgi:hypothetical protein